MKKSQQLTLNFDDEDLAEEVVDTTAKINAFQPIGGIFDKYKLKDKGGYITKEFQDFGYRMALELEDASRTSLYMRLAKNTNRAVLEQALSFVADAPNVKSKSKLFMWKLKQLKDAASEKKSSKPDKT
jgi:hypothetical protein